MIFLKKGESAFGESISVSLSKSFREGEILRVRMECWSRWFIR